MRERPILFSGPMVRAILEGRKSQTRRVVKPQPSMLMPVEGKPWPMAQIEWPDDHTLIVGRQCSDTFGRLFEVVRCPYGQPGDRLWVRETCRAHEITTKEAEADTYGVMARLGLETPPYGLDGVIYAADSAFREIENTREASDRWGDLYAYRGKRGATVPPIHMPRWACRIVLEVTGVRVERLQDISEADAKAEGVGPLRGDGRMENGLPATDGFADLWESINGAESWASNPWVWVVEFQPQPQ